MRTEMRKLMEAVTMEDEDLGESVIVEAWPSNSWAILPATMTLYNRRTVDIKTAVSEWGGNGQIIVCKNEEGRVCFLVSSGDMGIPVGTAHKTHHDQTGQSKGVYTVINIINMKDGEIASKVNNMGVDMKASVAVFK